MASKFSAWIRPYPELSLEGDGVFCKSCGKSISSTKKYFIDLHCGTPLHKRNLEKSNSSKLVQTSLRDSLSSSKKKDQDMFKFDLCQMMIASNIPLYKVNHPSFKLFFEKHFNKSLPEESTLRKQTLDKCYVECISKIKRELEGNFLYIVVDETTDVCGRYIANLMVGILNENFPSKSYLVAVKELEKTNNLTTISRFIQDSLTNLFLPNAIPTNKIVLMLSDAAAYMLKAASNLRVFYPNLIHCTCVAHGVNRIAEEIRNQFPLVNELINCMKKVFIKAPLRVQVYKERLPGVPLPPKPVITRWGTWLEAVFFYFAYLNEIKSVMSEFDDDLSEAIRQAKDILKNPKLTQQIAYISSNYKVIVSTITLIERQEISLCESVKLIDNLQSKIKSAPGSNGQLITKKMKLVFDKNEGFSFLCDVAKVLNGTFSKELQIEPDLLLSLKYAPITSVDVERSFSMYKLILSERRQSFKTENIEKHLVVAINDKTLSGYNVKC